MALRMGLVERHGSFVFHETGQSVTDVRERSATAVLHLVRNLLLAEQPARRAGL